MSISIKPGWCHSTNCKDFTTLANMVTKPYSNTVF